MVWRIIQGFPKPGTKIFQLEPFAIMKGIVTEYDLEVLGNKNSQIFSCRSSVYFILLYTANVDCSITALECLISPVYIYFYKSRK